MTRPGAERPPIASASGDAPTSVHETPTLVSVILVNYNGLAHLQRGLPALLAGLGVDYEIILVDNASSDGSADHVRRAFPQVRLYRSARNLGFGAGANLGARQARGRYLAFLNPDTLVAPGWLEALLQALEDEPRAALATPQILLLQDRERTNTRGNEIHISGLTLCRGMGMPRQDGAEPEEVSAVSGAAFVARRDVFDALSGFDEAFFLYMEDTDLSWRARLAGHRCLYVPRSVVWHDYTLRFGPQKTFYQERNRYLMLLKSLRWPTILALLPALVLAEVVTWGFVLLRQPGRWRNKIRAYAWILRHWREIVAQWRATQLLRRTRDRDLLRGCTWRLAFEQPATGPASTLAHALFDPCFYLLRGLALALVWW